jgi:predicted ATPase/transcriptional regulator with XRE-family HTH domain
MPSDERESFGSVLRRLRRAAGLSQDALAERAQLSVDTIAALERGRRAVPHPETLGRLSEALRLSAADRDRLVTASHSPAPSRAPEPSPPAASGGRTPPPPTEAPAIPNNLPIPLASFVGREGDVERLRTLVGRVPSTARLVTLVGPGGIGKTRLAIQVARSLVTQPIPAASEPTSPFADGIWLVDLSALDDPQLVATSVAAALQAWESPYPSAMTTLVGTIGRRGLLLVLDGCEHLLDACARLAGTLLQSCPHLSILATSLEAFGIPGEIVWPVAPLSVAPSDSGGIDLDGLARSDAVRLFVERATAVRPDFALSAENAPTIAEICRQLDGIPLAIELAAARVKALDVTAIAGRLSDRFRFLTSGSRVALPRHQTLHALVSWSYDLLAPEEQSLFARLAVFTGGWRLDAAERVAPDRGDAFELIARLVDKSLVIHASAAGEPTRYRLLETIRQFAAERLAADGETAAYRERHARYYLTFLENAEAFVEGPEQVSWLNRIEEDVDNVRAALDWCVEADNAALGFHGAWCLAVLAWLRGYLKEIDRRFLTLLNLPSAAQAPADLRAKASLAAGYVAFYRGQLARAHGLIEGALNTFRALDRPRETGQALVWLGLVVDAEDQRNRALACHEEALAIFRQLGDPFWIARAATNVGRCLRRMGQYGRATGYLEEALALRRAIGDARGVANTLHHLSDRYEMTGDFAEARRHAEEALTIAQSVGDRFVSVRALIGIGRQSYALDDRPQAARYLREALAVAQRDGFGHEMAEIAVYLALIVRDEGDRARARALADDGLRLAQADNRKTEAARALYLLGDLANQDGQQPQARAYFRSSLLIYQQVPNPEGVGLALAGVARTVQPEPHAARLAGAAEAIFDQAGARILRLEQKELGRALGELTRLRAQPDGASAWSAGRSAPVADVIADALASESIGEG